MTAAKADKTAPRQAGKGRAYASAGAAMRISAAEFMAWQEELGLSNGAAAAALFISPNTVTAVRAEGGSAELALKCRAIAAGLSPALPMKEAFRLGRINVILQE
ncbi:hypothetical protein ACVILK_000713 [Bradyrhizobium embrapense]